MKRSYSYKIPKIVFLIAIILLASFIFPSGGANQENEIINSVAEKQKFNGTIKAEFLESKIGLLSPSINMSEKQTITMNLTRTAENMYEIDTVLRIDVEVTGDVDQQVFLGRYLTTCILVEREDKCKINDADLSEGSYIERLLQSIYRIDLFSDEEKYIDIPIQYKTDCVLENIDVYIFAIGTPLQLIGRGLPGISSKKIDLELVYNESENRDVTPPETICELEEIILE